MAKFCVKCGAQLEDDGVCSICGAPPQAPEPPAQPQYPEQPAQQQYGSQQPQQPYAPAQAPSQFGYDQPSAPAKKKNKKMLIILIIAGAAAVIIALILTGVFPIGGEPDKNTDDAPVVETAEEDTTGEEPVVETTEVDVTEEEEDEEEEDNTVPDEPPFLTALRSGVYGYDMHMIAIRGDETVEGDSFVYSDGSLIAIGVVDDGEVTNRYIYNCETHTLYWVFDEEKQYATQENCDFWHKFGIPDFHAGFEQIGAGTTEFEGETFDYIDCVDCGSGEEVVRILIKDGDVYAFQHNANKWAHNLYLTKTFSSPPTTEYFEIPDDYDPPPSR